VTVANLKEINAACSGGKTCETKWYAKTLKETSSCQERENKFYEEQVKEIEKKFSNNPEARKSELKLLTRSKGNH
jgi:hypothetical protein